MGDYLCKYDCWLAVCPLPDHIDGLIKDKNGQIIILINENLSEEKREEALQHELQHLKRGDLYADQPISVLESM